MKTRKHTLVALGAFALAGMLAFAESRAAVSVVNNGQARSCYIAAVQNESARIGIATCSNALELDELSLEDHAATLVNRGILRERVSDYHGAISDYDESLALRPNLADAYVNRGVVLLKLHEYNDAYENFSKGIALGPQYPEVAYYDRGLVREHIGDFMGACADYKQALAIQPRYALAEHQIDICGFHYRPRS